MSKQVRLTDHVVAALEAEMKPRDTYSDAVQRLLIEVRDYRAHVRVIKPGQHATGANDE